MLADLRTAARSLRRAPGLVAAAVLTIALGAAANATAFAWFKGVALDPLPHVRDARGLVHVQTLGRRSGDRSGLSYPDYRDWRAQARSVTGLAAYAFERFGVRTAPPAGPGATEVVWGNYATADYFTTLGARPALGRFWRPDEASTAGGAPVAVLSDALWRRRFGADPGAVGRTVWVNGVACTVIGVAPRDFAGAFVGMAFDLWVPVTMYPRLADWKEKLDRRESFWLYAFARPRPGLALGEVNAELRAVAARVAAAEPSARDHVPLAAAFDEGQAQQIMRPLFGLLVGAALLVQLVVCANVGNLLLARAAARERELGVRAALGAGPPPARGRAGRRGRAAGRRRRRARHLRGGVRAPAARGGAPRDGAPAAAQRRGRLARPRRRGRARVGHGAARRRRARAPRHPRRAPRHGVARRARPRPGDRRPRRDAHLGRRAPHARGRAARAVARRARRGGPVRALARRPRPGRPGLPEPGAGARRVHRPHARGPHRRRRRARARRALGGARPRPPGRRGRRGVGLRAPRLRVQHERVRPHRLRGPPRRVGVVPVQRRRRRLLPDARRAASPAAACSGRRTPPGRRGSPWSTRRTRAGSSPAPTR
jgi:hypothetical protein